VAARWRRDDPRAAAADVPQHELPAAPVVPPHELPAQVVAARAPAPAASATWCDRRDGAVGPLPPRDKPLQIANWWQAFFA